MKIEAKKAVVVVTLTLDEDEAVMLVQLANQVAGDAPRALFYGELSATITGELEKHHVEVPPAAKEFKIHRGKLFAMPLPKTLEEHVDNGDPEPKMGANPKFV